MAASNTSTAPAEWPGAFGVYKNAKTATVKNGWAIAGILLSSLIISAALRSAAENSAYSWVVMLVAYLISFWLQFSLTALYLAGTKDETLKAEAALRKGIGRYVDGFIAALLTALAVGVSFLLFIVPALFVIPRLALVLYFVFDKDMSGVDAVKASWTATKGHSLKIWGVIAVTLVYALLCIILIGIYLSFMYQTAMAILYRYIDAHPAASVE